MVDKADAVYTSTEEIKLRLRWKNLQNVKDVGLRIEIWNLEDVPQATYFLYNFYSGKANQTAEVQMELDVSLFMDADYQMVFTFFYKDEFGNNQDIECVHGIRFSKTTNDAKQKWVWRAKYWGYLQMPAPKIVEIVER